MKVMVAACFFIDFVKWLFCSFFEVCELNKFFLCFSLHERCVVC